jgi:hypothetical protein
MVPTLRPGDDGNGPQDHLLAQRQKKIMEGPSGPTVRDEKI